MDISVILCTYNRSQSLNIALESLAASVLPATTEWEVLVVDNNSKDDTRRVTERFCGLDSRRFRYVFEAQQGKSYALNTGIRQANGEILAFVDDDVIVEPDWLHNLTACLRNDQWAGVGGRILPPVGFSPPPWLGLKGPWGQGGVLCAQFDFGDNPQEIKGEPPYGTNMAFRKEMFVRYGGFRTDLGPRPGTELRNEDTEFGRRLMAAGERLCYEPSAVVYHSIAKERLKKKFFRNWWYAFGRAKVREEAPRPKVWGIPRYYFSLPNVALRCFLPQVVRSFVARDPHERFSRQCIACTMAGIMAETWSQAFKGPPARRLQGNQAHENDMVLPD